MIEKVSREKIFRAIAALLIGLLSACTSAPAIVVATPAPSVTFGSVVLGRSGTATVTLANNGKTDASKLADASTSLGDFSYTGGVFPGTNGNCTDTIVVNETCTLSLSFAPTVETNENALLTIDFFDGAATQSLSLQLSGTGAAPVSTSTFDPSVYAPADAAIGQKVDTLGTTTTQQSGSSPVLQANKAASDDAITIIALSSDPSNYLLIDTVSNPDSQIITSVNFFDNFGDFTLQEINRAFPSQGAQAMVIPQTPDAAAQTGAGPYTFVITALDAQGNGASGVSADVYVVHQPPPTAQVPLTHVDVNLFLSGSAGLTAANAPTSVPFQAIIGYFVAAWGEVAPCTGAAAASSLGLCIDSINYYDLPSGYADAAGDFSETNPGTKDLIEVFEQSAGHSVGVNFFFLDDVSIDGVDSSSGLLGVDGNIPSPGAFMGTPRSGAAVILDTLPNKIADQERLGSTIAHEGGHYLGLYHVQESDCAPDNLSDTPCDATCVKDPSDAHQANASSCTATTEETDTNVMFWAAMDGVQTTTFTSEQATTTRRHPLVH
jgi:hypothetical protein